MLFKCSTLNAKHSSNSMTVCKVEVSLPPLIISTAPFTSIEYLMTIVPAYFPNLVTMQTMDSIIITLTSTHSQYYRTGTNMQPSKTVTSILVKCSPIIFSSNLWISWFIKWWSTLQQISSEWQISFGHCGFLFM